MLGTPPFLATSQVYVEVHSKTKVPTLIARSSELKTSLACRVTLGEGDGDSVSGL